MKIPVVCESCGHLHQVDAAHAGRRGKCTQCGALMTVPTTSTAESALDEESGAYGIDMSTVQP